MTDAVVVPMPQVPGRFAERRRAAGRDRVAGGGDVADRTGLEPVPGSERDATGHARFAERTHVTEPVPGSERGAMGRQRLAERGVGAGVTVSEAERVDGSARGGVVMGSEAERVDGSARGGVVMGSEAERVVGSARGGVVDVTTPIPAADATGVGAATAAGDLEALYTELAPRVLGYLRAQGVREPEDVLGEVFVQVARDFDHFRGDQAARRRWVFTIAHHRMVDTWRRRATRPHVVDAPVPDLPSSEPSTESLDPQLVDALARLTDDQREIVVLRYVADLPARDVARITRRRVGAVKALQRRGLAALERLLADS
jgi:RNA polymerase sigma-70 factor (ECF subfamily)